MDEDRQNGENRATMGSGRGGHAAGGNQQEQQREGSVGRQQNQQRDRQEQREQSGNPGLEESNRIDLDENGRRDQQA
ncbi:hypothetical protein [Sphingomonas crocodyli]|uniref:Uncharacterized protein n=1 Tax=Sphingomonas crocodyli TaxID=1979270 RepID=A0A437LXX6_9SPHN|nr:hypothetical protein [Sphingomonas crocodyli]RVT90265.1 hypothetical protein EOD43_18420 [Sphingomonas crocodyli]